VTSSGRAPSGAAVFSPSVTDAILTAVMDEWMDCGVARLSMDRVARRARVGKSALYRRWPSKVHMVTEVLARLSVPTGPPPDTGELRGDVRAMLQATYDWLTDPRIAAVLPDLIAESQRNAALAEATVEHVTGPRLAWARLALERSKDRGELRAQDVDVLLDLLIAPTFWRLVHDRPVDNCQLDRLSEVLLEGLLKEHS
jgi:AcrR family transcriptional regulator